MTTEGVAYPWRRKSPPCPECGHAESSHNSLAYCRYCTCGDWRAYDRGLPKQYAAMLAASKGEDGQHFPGEQVPDV